MTPEFKCGDDVLCTFIDHHPEMGKIVFVDHNSSRIKVELIEGEHDGDCIWFKFSEISQQL
jgi:hypothetical protein